MGIAANSKDKGAVQHKVDDIIRRSRRSGAKVQNDIAGCSDALLINDHPGILMDAVERGFLRNVLEVWLIF